MKEKPKRKTTPELSVIGWREYVDLPAWGLFQVRAKADTGARSSAVDVSHIEELPGDRVRFEVMADRDGHDDCARRKVVEAEVVRRTRIRSSFGHAHDRLFVTTPMVIGGRTVEAEVGLVNRENMICRMLLGRKTLDGIFVVDPGRIYIHGRRKRKAKRREKVARQEEE